MGVYIYMEMPHDGRYTVCVTHDSHGVVHWVFQNQDTLEFLKHGAVTEIHEPHGRLIEKSALLDKCYQHYEDFMMRKVDGKTALLNIEKEIKAAPIVIPTSKEGEA